MERPSIRVEGLWKQYRLGQSRKGYQTFREKLMDTFTRKRDRAAAGNGKGHAHFWALQDVNFAVEQGDVVGVIGRNGAGKSTLLKVLSRITEPTRGFAEVRGRLSSLLEVGTGFHPELTGRENVFLSAAILGMKRHEIIRRFDEIVAFSEVESFIDTPVKHYSSGMYLRLAFAVAAHLETENLLVDEILAVGDQAFQRRCLGKMRDVANNGRTVLFVSHNMAAVQSLCRNGLLIRNGSVDMFAPVGTVIDRYAKDGTAASVLDIASRTDREGKGDIRFAGVTIRDGKGVPQPQGTTGEPLQLQIQMEYANDHPATNFDIAVHFHGTLGELFFVCQRSVTSTPFEKIESGASFLLTIPKLPLPPGVYYLTLWCATGQGKDDKQDKVENAVQLTVISGDFYGTGRLLAQKNRSVLIDYSFDQDKGA